MKLLKTKIYLVEEKDNLIKYHVVEGDVVFKCKRCKQWHLLYGYYEDNICHQCHSGDSISIVGDW